MPTLVISSRLVSRAPDITRILDKLEHSGWIERVRSTDDRRAVLIKLTAAGRKVVKDIAEPLTDSHVAQLGHLSDKELTQLCNLLRKVRAPHEPDNSTW